LQYLNSLHAHATREAALLQRFRSALEGVLGGSDPVQKSAIAALKGMAGELRLLSVAVSALNVPPDFVRAHAEKMKGLQHMTSAVEQTERALGEQPAKLASARTEVDRSRACYSSSTGAVAATLGVAAANTAAIPVVGHIVAALAAIIAAIYQILGQIYAKLQAQARAAAGVMLLTTPLWPR
jgi:hypothetical protein